jgi:hypothetical protein
LPIGVHNVTILVWDDAGNMGTSKTVNFNVTDPTPASVQSSESLLNVLIVAVPLTLAAVFASGILFHVRKRNPEKVK